MTGKGAVGIIDSGVGGLAVAKELRALCPGGDFLYVGDSANCPYGNRTQGELLALNLAMLRYLRARGAGLAAVACNTTSAILDKLQALTDLPLLGIVAPMAGAVTQSGARRVGVFATAFTTASGIYPRLINARDPAIEVYGQASRDLARIIEEDGGDAAIGAELRASLSPLLERGGLDTVILGCTHYEIHTDLFYRSFPGVRFLLPAREQARAVVARLAQQGLPARGMGGRLDVRTTGDPRICGRVLARLGLAADTVERVTL